MTSRRKFLSGIAQLGLYSTFTINLKNGIATFQSPQDEKDISWKKIKKCFPISKNHILNLNNGSASVMPNSVSKKYNEAIVELNNHAPYEVFAKWQKRIERTYQNLASEFDIQKGQLVLVRNTTEAVNMILWGLPFEKKDEVIYADWDYPYMNYSLRHIRDQKSIKLKIIQSTLVQLNDEEIVNLYREKITQNTKLIIITWITHREGRILPVKKIRDLAKEHNIEVLIDGAHVPGHIAHSIDQIDPEYYATSLHKWFNAPLGTGLLYLNQDVVKKISPPISYAPNLKSDYVKYEYLGTRSFQDMIGVEEALIFLNKTGIERKQTYLKSLSDYWIANVKDIKGFNLMTSTEYTCAINSFYIEGTNTKLMKEKLQKEFNVHTKTSAYERQNMNFIRISPNIYSDYKDLDRLIDGIKQIVASNH